MDNRHTLSILVENQPGVLARVAALFTRRDFNIHSLAVGETEEPAISRITVQVDAEDLPFEQVTKQLNKLVNVLKVVELHPQDSVTRKFVLFKVQANAGNRSQVLQIVDLFRASVVDVHRESLVIQAAGVQSKLEALMETLAPYGINEIVQSGAVAIGRGPRSITDQLKEK
ncbi:MAG: acetolactate synthase small subunit [Varibaculum cambriense]|uniref:acetolactate synthase small subunit n=1 Tax=Varibaculum cambriense TaxID=184870 RepID=UPI00241C42E5|nr:acetolactate synthase small subunit [Varibaculum cambriense]MBS6620093.1 acetolactate synthase small subunit [Varibaculum cambriense]